MKSSTTRLSELGAEYCMSNENILKMIIFLMRRFSRFERICDGCMYN